MFRRPWSLLPSCPTVLSALLALALPAGRLEAQRDSARVVYRAGDVVFLDAGSDRSLSVGDTLDVLAPGGTPVGRAVVVSRTRTTASARLLPAVGEVAPGATVAFTPRTAEPAGVSRPAGTPGPDSARSPPPAAPTVRPAARAPRRRWRGGAQVGETWSSSGGSGGVATSRTAAGVSLTGPLGPSFTLTARGTARWRTGSGIPSSFASSRLESTVYVLDLRVSPPGARWNASVGRLLPSGATAAGYVDGARIEWRTGAGSRFGALGGTQPQGPGLAVSGSVRRAGAYWVTESGGLSASVSMLTDWARGGRRRTELTADASLAPRRGPSLWLRASGTSASKGEPDPGVRLRTFHASASTGLPLGLRFRLGVQSHEPMPLFDPDVPPDTTPLPGRITTVNGSLGRAVGPLYVDLAGSVQRRAGDPSPTVRGALSASGGGVLLSASTSSGPLYGFHSIRASVPLTARGAPVVFFLGAGATATRTEGDSTRWRLSVSPELSAPLSGGWHLSAGGDIGRYAGRFESWLHAGVSYGFR